MRLAKAARLYAPIRPFAASWTRRRFRASSRLAVRSENNWLIVHVGCT
jgi:hypothetical protein